MDALRYNQMHVGKPQKAVPFRDSKMTRLFQDYFTGHGVAAMLVNINPQVSDYDESSRVLKFSSIAQDVKIAVSRIDTGRVQNKTKSRLNAEKYEGNAEEIGLVTPAPPQPKPEQQSAPPSSQIRSVQKKVEIQSSKKVDVRKAEDEEKKKKVEAEGKRKAVEADEKRKAVEAEERKKKPEVEEKKNTVETVEQKNVVEMEQQYRKTIVDLEAEVERLKTDLSESLANNVRLEASIREEVASEFAQEIFRNQLQCEERVAEIRECLEEKYEKKISILDELNKTNANRHAQKYQELVAEYNELAEEYENRELELQQKLKALLSAQNSGSSAEYNMLIQQLEQQKLQLENQLKAMEGSKQEWKKQVGQIAESRIAQLERENAELKEELKNVRNSGKNTVKKMFGLKKKQDSKENVDEGIHEGDGWANISLDQNDDDQDKPEKGKSRRKFGNLGGSWRKRKAQEFQSQQLPTASKAPPSEKDILEIIKPKNDERKHKKAQPSKTDIVVQAPPPITEEIPPVKRQDSDSMRISDLLNIQEAAPSNLAGKRTSPLLQKRSISGRVPSGTTAENVPIIVPQQVIKGGNRARKPPSKFLF